MQAHELMTRHPACATTNASAEQVARLMALNDCGCVPVLDAEDNRVVVGVVTDRDLTVRGVAKGKGPSTPISELMSLEVVWVPGDADVIEVEQLMLDRQVRRVVVTDADGCCIGILSLKDL